MPQQDSKFWTAKRIVGWSFVGPLMAGTAIILSPFALLWGISEGIAWLFNAAFEETL
jgi:hypothetical protein